MLIFPTYYICFVSQKSQKITIFVVFKAFRKAVCFDPESDFQNNIQSSNGYILIQRFAQSIWLWFQSLRLRFKHAGRDDEAIDGIDEGQSNHEDGENGKILHLEL